MEQERKKEMMEREKYRTLEAEEEDDHEEDDDEWIELYDDIHERKYYFNASLGQTSWTKPISNKKSKPVRKSEFFFFNFD